jgi:hypothetical protein
MNARWLPLLALLAADVHDKKDAAGGEHWRLETPRGPVHVWRPDDWDPKTAGVVIYVHGHFDTVDEAWSEHQLPQQFAASRRNAMFIAPEAPTSYKEDPQWTSLGDLLRVVRARVGFLPSGPLVAIGHSGAYRTVIPWMEYAPLDHVILLDAMYGSEEDVRVWLDEARGHEANRLTIVSEDTIRWSDPFVDAIPDATTLGRMPESWTRTQLRARVLYVRTKIDHMELVTGKKVIPVLLRRAPLGDL